MQFKAFKHHTMLIACIALAALFPQPLLAEDSSPLAEPPSLYSRLGGLAPISVVVSDFIDLLVVDDELNANPAVDAARKQVPAAYLKYQVTSLMCASTGGPCIYQGRGMKEAHAHLNITEPEWDRMIVLFKEVLTTHQVPQQETEELLEIIDSTKDAIVVQPVESE